MENKKVVVTDFVNKYKTLTSEKIKSDYIASIIKRTYCPVLEKKLILELMLEKSVSKDDMPTIDMFANKLNLCASIIALYTHIVPVTDENGVAKSFEMYDLLVENDLLNPIFALIGEREISELTSINGLLLDNWYAKNTSIQAYANNFIETASRRFGIATELILDKVNAILDDDVKMKKLLSSLEKVIKKIK